MIFAEKITLMRTDEDGILIAQVFLNSYYWQAKGQVFIEELNRNVHQFSPKVIKEVRMSFNPTNVEPFKL